MVSNSNYPPPLLNRIRSKPLLVLEECQGSSISSIIGIITEKRDQVKIGEIWTSSKTWYLNNYLLSSLLPFHCLSIKHVRMKSKPQKPQQFRILMWLLQHNQLFRFWPIRASIKWQQPIRLQEEASSHTGRIPDIPGEMVSRDLYEEENRSAATQQTCELRSQHGHHE